MVAAPFGQSRPSVCGVSGMPLDVDDLVALRVDELAAADRAVRDRRRRSLRFLDLQRRGGRLDRREVEAGRRRPRRRRSRPPNLRKSRRDRLMREPPRRDRQRLAASANDHEFGAGQLFPHSADDDDALGPSRRPRPSRCRRVQRGEVGPVALVADDERLLAQERSVQTSASPLTRTRRRSGSTATTMRRSAGASR